MKQTTKMSRAVSQLEHIYNSLNTDFFGGELPVPIVTVQSRPGTYGHCSVAKVWRKPDENTYELNIAAEVLNYPIEETVGIFLPVAGACDLADQADAVCGPAHFLFMWHIIKYLLVRHTDIPRHHDTLRVAGGQFSF